MNSVNQNSTNTRVGVVGCGQFGTAIANILSHNTDVTMYVYRQDLLHSMLQTRVSSNQSLNQTIYPTDSIQDLANTCELIFIIVPSKYFRFYLQKIAPFLDHNHILIHGTKGLFANFKEHMTRQNIQTMTDVLLAETNCKKVGCISGPNIAKELADNQPAGVVLASKDDNILRIGHHYLTTSTFKVYTSHDLLGTELSGIFKNAIAIAVGFVAGMNYGYNTQALVLSLGLSEITSLGQALGADLQSFIGLAGVGDLVATSMSSDSRNHSFGRMLASAQDPQNLLAQNIQTVEGINTIKIMHTLSISYNLHLPIVSTLYKFLFEKMKKQDILHSFWTLTK